MTDRSHRPPYALPPTFMGVGNSAPSAAWCVAGIPFDLGTSNRPGARFAPAAIRMASRMLVDGDHPTHWTDPLTLDLADVGDFILPHGDVAGGLAAIEAQAAPLNHLVALGGDHTVTLALLRALAKKHGRLALVHFDAHCDTWPDTFGQVLSHGAVFHHAITEGLVDPARMIQIGIRSPIQRAVWDWTLAQGVRVVGAEQVHLDGPVAVAELARTVVGGGPAYLSFDIDAIDPGQAPGTGTPEVGGLFTWQASAILRRLGGIAFVGMDVVEVSPPSDVADITALAAATIAWEYLCLMAAEDRCAQP